MRSSQGRMDHIHDPIGQAFIGAGLDPTKGNNPKHASGGAFTSRPDYSAVLTLLFAFYVMIGGNPFFLVLANLSPIIEHKTSKTTPADAALEALVARGLVRLGTGKPTVILPIHGLFDHHSLIYFVRVNQAVLVQQGHSWTGSKMYSLVNPETVKTKGGKDASIIGFGPSEYEQMLKALSGTPISAPLPSSAGFARGGGGGAVAGGGKSVLSASSLRLAELPSLHTGMSNAFVLLFLQDPSKCILLVQTRSDNCWGLPGGMVNKGEHPSATGPREFLEETKSECPEVRNQRFFQWTHRSGALTGFISGDSTARFSDFKKNFRQSREILNIGFFTVEQVYQMALGLDPMNQMRKCAKESTIAILQHMKLVI